MNVDSCEGIDSPLLVVSAGILLLHELLDKLREPALQNALTQRVHQGELGREGVRVGD